MDWLIFLSASHTNSSREVHADHESQFGHVYYIGGTLEINNVTLHEAELSNVGVPALCTDSNRFMQMAFCYTIYCIQDTFFCSSSCENISMHGSSLKWEILGGGEKNLIHICGWVQFPGMNASGSEPNLMLNRGIVQHKVKQN
jgi:hypothetical protein